MSQLTDLIAQLPYVTRLERTQDCDAYRWSHMPLKALRDPAVAARWKCKARARWQFEALPPDGTGLGSQSGTYCWRHLFVQIWGHPPEEERYKRAVTELRGPQPWHYTGGGPITR